MNTLSKPPVLLDGETGTAFQDLACPVLAESDRTLRERAAQYGDTLTACQWVTAKAVAKELKLDVPDHVWRAIHAACLVDIKYVRNMGGYKEDNGTDGIAYWAFLQGEMRNLL